MCGKTGMNKRVVYGHKKKCNGVPEVHFAYKAEPIVKKSENMSKIHEHESDIRQNESELHENKMNTKNKYFTVPRLFQVQQLYS